MGKLLWEFSLGYFGKGLEPSSDYCEIMNIGESLVKESSNSMNELREPKFASEGGSDYEVYIRTDELLVLQPEPATWKHRDELLFTVVHQSSELWLKLAVAEIDHAVLNIDKDLIQAASRYLIRARDCIHYTTTQLPMLEKMTPWDYQHVRTALGHGSGFDSPGFRNIRESLKVLVTSVQQALGRADLTLEKLYLDVEANESLYSLVELLVDLDEALMIWRSVHVKVIERTIGGTVSGTQGTPVEVVRNLRDRSIMEELWDVRVNLTERADRELASDG